MFTLENKFKTGDKIKFKSDNTIFPDLKGTVFSPYGNHHVIVDFDIKDNGHSYIFDDNDLDNFRLHKVATGMLESWEE